jgi:aminoglycoside phosphotransferase (APT) family kinase protein
MEVVVADLERHLRELWSDEGLAVKRIEPFGDGHSGFTYAVEFRGERAGQTRVLRLSPPKARIAGSTDIGRQGRIMTALGDAGLPVPEILACSSLPVIDGRSFALMELIEGESWAVARSTASAREALSDIVGLISSMQALEPAATGIGDEEPMTPAAEVERWSWLVGRSPEWLQERSVTLREGLARTAPPPARPVLVHGDFHFGNLLFEGASVVAVLDWEIAQLGEPMLDVASLAVSSIRRRHEPAWKHTATVETEPLELLEIFGVDVREVSWFVALGCFKYASILGYNYQLHLSGKRPDPVYEQLVPSMVGLLDDGVTTLAGGLQRLGREVG